MQETWLWSLDQEDPLEKEMATHSSILAWEIPWTEEPGGLQSMVCQESDTTEWLTISLLHFKLFKGNTVPLLLTDITEMLLIPIKRNNILSHIGSKRNQTCNWNDQLYYWK